MAGHKKKKGRITPVLIVILLLISAVGLFYPTISSRWNNYRNRKLMSGYRKSVSGMSRAEEDKIWKEAAAYNAQHKVNNPTDPFKAKNEKYIKTHPYDDLLNPNGDGVMGELEIPKIKVDLPIFHGTGPEALQRGCGHLMGTSLPVGGKGTHAVLSAHRGLPSAKLFTDLDQIQTGDQFYLHILDRILAYQVDQILTVQPDQSEALAIDPNQDYCTLVTCTPYGVNTHRLLVRGHRVKYVPADKDKESGRAVRGGINEKILICGVILLGLIILIMLLIYRITGRKKKK